MEDYILEHLILLTRFLIFVLNDKKNNVLKSCNQAVNVNHWLGRMEQRNTNKCRAMLQWCGEFVLDFRWINCSHSSFNLILLLRRKSNCSYSSRTTNCTYSSRTTNCSHPSRSNCTYASFNLLLLQRRRSICGRRVTQDLQNREGVTAFDLQKNREGVKVCCSVLWWDDVLQWFSHTQTHQCTCTHVRGGVVMRVHKTRLLNQRM